MLYVTYEGVLGFYITMIYKENFMEKLAEALNEHRLLLRDLKRAQFMKEKYEIEKRLDANWKKLKEAFFSPEKDDEADEKAVQWIFDNPTN